MVTLPAQFVQIDPYPGYYWHRDEKALYSCKIDGVLKRLTFQKGFRGYAHGTRIDRPDGYTISVKGNRRVLTIERILAIVAKVDANATQTFPMEGK